MKVILFNCSFIIGSGLKFFLQTNFSKVLIQECSVKENELKKIKDYIFDLAIIDINFGTIEASYIIQRIKKASPSCKILLFTNLPEHLFAKRCFDFGIDGYLRQTADLHELKNAIISILKGKKYICDKVKKQFVKDFFYTKPAHQVDNLTPKEFEIASRLVSGQKSSEIAVLLKIHTSTVGTYKSRIFKKLGIHNLLELHEIFSSKQSVLL